MSVKEQKHVSLQTVERLSVYRKVLEELDHDGVEYIHSHELAALVGVTPAQLRRDLASFGTFGNIARGYNVYQMSRTISRILGTDETQNVALFGVGDLGRALLSYRGLRGARLPHRRRLRRRPREGRARVRRPALLPVDQLETVLREFDVHMAILASRPEGLQTLVDRVVRRRRARRPQLRAQARRRARRLLRRAHRHLVASSRCSRSWRAAQDAAETARRRRPRRVSRRRG